MTTIKKVITFLSSNAVALASLCIAGMGLYLTITAQRAERDHKELLIRPSIDVGVEVSDFSIVMTNNGLGPAVIKDAVYVLDGKCISPASGNRKSFALDNYTKANTYIMGQVGSLLDSVWWKDKFKTTLTAHSSLPVPGQIIAVGKQVVIYKLDPEFASELHTKLWELGAPTFRSVTDKFMAYAMSMPFRIRYCSMSGAYCRTTVQGTDNSPSPLPADGE